MTSCTLSPTFASETTAYTCTVDNSVTSTTVSATATSSVAIVSGTGSKSLSVGTNTITVEVTSQSGSVKTYNVSVTRLPNSDASLKAFGVTGYTISPTFTSDTLVYTLTVPYSIDSITITGTATASTSSIDGLGSKTLSVGENTYDIKVTAEDRTTKTYTLVVTRQQDSDTSLKSLSVTEYSIVKVDDNHYTLTVANDVTSVEVNATATSSVAVVTGTGTKALSVGSNVITVQVTAQDGTISVYEIDITRQASSDATLSALSVTGYTISPTFSSETTSYTLTVPYSVTSLTVTPTVNNSEASYTVSGNTSLAVGSNTVTIKVTAGDGTTKTYTITVTREKDTTSTLKSLSLTDCTLSPTFASGTTSYTCTVDNSVTSTTVSAVATSSVATVSGTGSKSLSVGTNTVTVKVTAQSGATKSYTVTVTRKASSDATLSGLTISSGTLSPTFSSGTTSYTATVAYSVTSLTVTPTVNNSEASYIVSGNTSLAVGTNTVTIEVTAGDGTTKTYTITVTRSKDTDATLKSLAITGYSLSPTFASGTTSYTATVEASSVTITAAANSSVATVSGTGSKTLSWGSNTASIIVTAQDGIVKTYVITITNQQPTAPTITGGSDSWVTTAPTISVSTAGSAISGVKQYEYYTTTSTDSPTDNTTATGTLTTSSSSITISEEGTTYVYYRTVSNNGFKSNWSDYQTVKLGTIFSTKIHSDNTLITTSPTLTTSSNNSSDTSGLYKSTDTNSGEATYYFRGNVTNNYVSFAGLTWRIVRINEDGTIRLIAQSGVSGSFTSSTGNYSDLYYTNSSVAKPTLDSWYETNIVEAGYSDNIATGDYFCEQAKVKYYSSYVGGNAVMTLYSSYNPNFKCETDGNGYGVVNGSVGLITYNEAIYAGGYVGSSNTNYYLYNGYLFYTMSPAGYSSSYHSRWVVNVSGSLQYYVNDNSYLRPVINLNADVAVTGNGTSTNPYVVQS